MSIVANVMRVCCDNSLFLLDRLGSLSQPLDLESFGSLEEWRQLILGNVYFAGVHELQDSRQVLERNVLEDDDRMFGRVLFQKSLEVGRTSWQDHLVSFTGLTIAVKDLTSVKDFSSRRCLKEETMLVWKSFHRRQNCWSPAWAIVEVWVFSFGWWCFLLECELDFDIESFNLDLFYTSSWTLSLASGRNAKSQGC